MIPVRSHWRPRSRRGRLAVTLFAALFALSQPPLAFWIANRIEPRTLGVPFLYVYLLVLYVLLIGVLIAARRKGL